MIHTLTLNTAIDMNIFCDPLQPAAVNRTRQTEYCPNGKGVNVSLVLHHYQQPTHVMGIFGGLPAAISLRNYANSILMSHRHGSLNRPV